MTKRTLELDLLNDHMNMRFLFTLVTILFLVFSVSCESTQRLLRGKSGPVAWEATEFQITRRTIEGQLRDLYAFTLVLNELNGHSITFTKEKCSFQEFSN